jgi:hypothetical protein
MSFWDIDEIQQIFDETTELCVSKSEIKQIGDRLQSEGYRLIKTAVFVPDSSPQPRTSFVLEMREKLHPLLESAITILRESLEHNAIDERKVQIALEVLGIAFTSGVIDL